MEESFHPHAPLWRRTGANLVDMALLGGLLWLARSRGWVRDGGAVARQIAAPGDLLREQLRSPGQLLLGTVTVDRRTGRRVTPWRTLAVIGAGFAGRQIARRLEPVSTPEAAREQEAFGSELGEIMRRNPQASPQREAELQALHARHHRDVPSLLRTAVPSLAVGLTVTRLRRRLAPTVEILARGR